MKKNKVVTLNGVEMSWDEFVGEVRKLLKSKPGQMREIERITGLTYRWINDFKRAEWRDATADMVIRLAQGLGLRFRVLVDATQLAGQPAALPQARSRKPSAANQRV